MCVRNLNSLKFSYGCSRKTQVTTAHEIVLNLDRLLLDLKETGVGCFWGHHFAGALAHADDVVLLAPLASGLTVMLRACEDFALSNSLSFNPLKT